MEWEKAMGQVRFLTFSQFHNKNPVAGSTHIRVNQLIKYWPEADLYKYGENPDVLIFQKVYVLPDYTFPKHFKGIKILDMCDPDWMNGLAQVKETVDAMDAVTTSSKPLADFMSQLTDKPVVHIPDRFDLEDVPKPKIHKGKAKSVVWFGYSHNADLLKPAIKVIEELGLKLIVISDHDPFAWRWGSGKLKDGYTYIKYDEETIYHDLQRADYCILPEGNRPVDKFKSNNKAIKALLAGLPVVKDRDGMERMMDGKARNGLYDDKQQSSSYEEIRYYYDVRKSVEQYKELINEIERT